MLKASSYTLLPPPPSLSHGSTTAARIALFPRCGNDAICLHYGNNIIQKSFLRLKIQMESQNWAPKIMGKERRLNANWEDWLPLNDSVRYWKKVFLVCFTIPIPAYWINMHAGSTLLRSIAWSTLWSYHGESRINTCAYLFVLGNRCVVTCRTHDVLCNKLE